MLALNSPDWGDIRTAYGSASNIPPLLAKLKDFPVSNSHEDEPWFSLWSALCHQGDVFSASFAAIPHVVEALSGDPSRADFNYFQLPVCVELARFDKGLQVPDGLDSAYGEALARLPGIAAKAAIAGWRDEKCAMALAATAIATGKYETARLLVEIDTASYRTVVERFLSE